MTNCTRQLWTLFIEIVSGSQTKFSQGMVLARQAFASEKSGRDRPDEEHCADQDEKDMNVLEELLINRLLRER